VELADREVSQWGNRATQNTPMSMVTPQKESEPLFRFLRLCCPYKGACKMSIPTFLKKFEQWKKLEGIKNAKTKTQKVQRRVLRRGDRKKKRASRTR
jgi:hypothetical protein